MISDAFFEGVGRRLGRRFELACRHFPTHKVSIFTAIRQYRTGRRVVLAAHLTDFTYMAGDINTRKVADGLRKPLRTFAAEPHRGINYFPARRGRTRTMKGK